MVDTPSKTQTPWSARSLRRVGFVVVGCAGLLWLASSERVVDFLFSFNDDPPAYFDPSGFPLKPSRTIALNEWTEIAVPSGIKQPSGVSVSGGKIAVVTDMAQIHEGVLYLVEPQSFQETGSKVILNRPLLFRQGYLEAVSYGSFDNILFAVGGGNILYEVQSNADGLSVRKETELVLPPVAQTDPEVEGMVYRESTDTVIVGLSPDPDAGILLAEYKLSGEMVRVIALSSDRLSDAVMSLLQKRANVTGLAISGSKLLVLSDRHSGLLWVNLETGQIEDVWTMQGLNGLSAISVEDGKLFLMQDHEYFEEAPPLRMLDITQYLMVSDS